MKFLTLILTTLLLSSCANYINKVHRDLDRADNIRSPRKARRHDTFSQFRGSPRSGISSINRTNMIPSIKRRYQSQSKKKRYTANDLIDNSTGGSLWAGSGNENYLFTKNKSKRNGDIVLMNVQKGFKSLITMELKRAFPRMPSRRKKSKAKEDKPKTEKAEPATVAENKDDTNTIHDKVSSVVIEEISKNHLLIRGQKFLLFRNKKRLVELQALVARRDIQDDDTIDSNDFLESTVSILR